MFTCNIYSIRKNISILCDIRSGSGGPGETSNGGIDTKNTSNPGFTIDMLPIVSKEDKFAPITQLSIVSSISKKNLEN